MSSTDRDHAVGLVGVFVVQRGDAHHLGLEGSRSAADANRALAVNRGALSADHYFEFAERLANVCGDGVVMKSA